MLIHTKIIIQPVYKKSKNFRKLFQLERSSEASSIQEHSPKKNEYRIKSVSRKQAKTPSREVCKLAIAKGKRANWLASVR